MPTDEAAGGAVLAGTAAGRVRDRTSLLAPNTSSCLTGSFKFPFRNILSSLPSNQFGEIKFCLTFKVIYFQATKCYDEGWPSTG